MITLFGATGYTGRLVAQALCGPPRGLPLRLAGRSPARLARLAETLPGSPPWLVADATRPETLPALFEDTRLLVNCAGPFTPRRGLATRDGGEALAALAVQHGVHYLDISNELGYVHRLQDYDDLARRSGAALVPACGFEVALADCAAAVLAADAETRPTDVSVVYDIQGAGSSLGSRLSAVRSLATSWLAYHDGHWQPAVPCRETRRVQLAGALRSVLSFPSAEIVTVPHHLPVQQVTTWTTISPGARLWAPRLLPLFARLARGPLGCLVEMIISSVWPPQPGMRRQAPFTIQVEARRGDESRTLTLGGQGVYELTAQIVAYAAARLLEAGYERAGVLAPAVALEPQRFLDYAVAHWGLEVQRDA